MQIVTDITLLYRYLIYINTVLPVYSRVSSFIKAFFFLSLFLEQHNLKEASLQSSVISSGFPERKYVLNKNI